MSGNPKSQHSDQSVDDAAQLGLAVVGQAAAFQANDDESIIAAEDNLRDTVDDLIDEPLTDRQEEVVEALAASSAALTAGLAGAVAADENRPVQDVLQGAARSILMQQRLDSDRDGDRSPGER